MNDDVVTDTGLIEYVQSIPLEDGYSLLATEFLLPWSVDEAWANIFDYEAPYSFDYALEELGDVIMEDSDWTDVEIMNS